jgi:hypothetical protein
MWQIRAADNKLRRLFQDAVITERHEALGKAIYSIKDDFVGMIGNSAAVEPRRQDPVNTLRPSTFTPKVRCFTCIG